MQLSVQEYAKENEVYIYVEGEIDAYTAPDLKEKLKPLAEEGQHIVVDLSQVNYIDSTGLGVFIGILKTMKKTDGELRLIQLLPRVRRLFSITGLDKVIAIEDSPSQKEEKR